MAAQIWDRIVFCLGALVGAGGVAAAAASAHLGGNYGAVATIALAHAPVFVALGLYGLRTRLLTVGALLLLAGTVLFCLDLTVRSQAGFALFPMSAPLGGMLMIGGWLVLAIAGLFTKS